MSFLEREEDADAMLAEALAFIDECNDKKTPKTSQKATRKPQKALQAQQCYSTQLQRRKKAELRALRDEALELEQQVSLLLKRRQGKRGKGGEKAEDDSQEWFKRAVNEFKQRQQAERKNRKLKEIWKNQEKVNAAFRHLTQRRSLLYGQEEVFDEEHKVVSLEDETMNIIAQLEKSVERLYLASDTVFPPDLPDTISCNTRVKRTDESQGNCIEVVTTTPVSCSLRVAADVVWKDLNVKGQDPERIYRFIQRRKPNSLEKNFLVALHNPSGVLKIDGFQFMRKYEEADRVVLIKANVLTLSNMGLRFHDRCWIIISRSKADPTHAAVARTCYQLYAEGSEASNGFATHEDIVHTRDYILSSLSGKVRRDHQMLQNLLIEEDRRAASRVVPMTA